MKMDFANDPVVNAVYQGIKKGIQVTYDNECLGSCLILIYCGMDSMTYLSLPANKNEADGQDFIAWAERYMTVNLTLGMSKVIGEELYSARCALVHTYTMESRKTRSGTRVIGYQYGGGSLIASDSATILLRIDYLRDAFYLGVNKFLMEAYADKIKQPILETRLRKLMVTIPYGTHHGEEIIKPI